MDNKRAFTSPVHRSVRLTTRRVEPSIRLNIRTLPLTDDQTRTQLGIQVSDLLSEAMAGSALAP